ncbi:MAG: putative 3-(3-hydroxy-phenyl)propionate hydroxylase, FAD/NAD(P)-binding [Frankiales bacterium]|jgi:3-(3-hydroxy-phenyl)propionate hydroxylase|nr:putative 3-(3-hydroxy-phenyl)propionate hydroxylase, FAD/NAD(P)-binding [Frankiales bacterium]
MLEQGPVRTCEVLVVGCGPVGAVLAARLGALGVEALVVDAATDVHPLPRAVAADDEVQHLLDLTAPGLLEGALHDVGVRLLSASRRELGAVRLPAGPSGHSGLALFSQPTLERRLRAHLATLEPVTVALGAELVSWHQDVEGVRARLGDGSRVRASWLVGCDGARSYVRRSAGIVMTGRELERPWLVVDVAGEVDRAHLSYTCDPARPQVDMPLPGGHRWEWLLQPGEAAPDPIPLLARDIDPSTVQVLRAATYRYGARQAATWRAGRVLLAGDAAHTMPPFAGHGLGAGIRDAWVLGGMLAAGDPSGYQALRSPHVRATTRQSLLLGAVVEARSPRLARSRDTLLHSAFRTPVLGRWLSRGGPRTSASGVVAR